MRDLISSLTRGRSPVVQNRTPIPLGGKPSLGGGLFAPGGDLVIGDQAFNAYGSVSTLFSIVKQLTEAFSTVEWHLYRKGPKRDKERRTEILNHGFLTVWNKPNPFMTGRMFRETSQQHLDLVGETIWVIYRVAGVIVEMWPVRPDRVKPVKHPTKFLQGWVYTGPDGEEVPLELDEVIQIKYPNPGDPYRGMGPVQTLLNDLDSARYSAEWNRNFFINGAQPGGVIEIDYKMSDPEWKAFVARHNAQHRGVANAHRVAVLENAKWVSNSYSMSDMQFVELRGLSREVIREAYAFPKPMLGTVDDVNRANSDAAKEIMAEQHTTPRCSRWKDVINNFLLPQFANGENTELDHDNPTPINNEAENSNTNSQWAAAKNGVTAGFDPAGVLEACGLPAMEWVGIPAAAPKTDEETEEGGGTE
jgi:HK97 family phage portal protein